MKCENSVPVGSVLGEGCLPAFTLSTYATQRKRTKLLCVSVKDMNPAQIGLQSSDLITFTLITSFFQTLPHGGLQLLHMNSGEHIAIHSNIWFRVLNYFPWKEISCWLGKDVFYKGNNVGNFSFLFYSWTMLMPPSCQCENSLRLPVDWKCHGCLLYIAISSKFPITISSTASGSPAGLENSQQLS